MVSPKRSQKTDLTEFYATTDLSNFTKLQEEFGYWEFYYNWHRPHGALNGKSPTDMVTELSETTPLSEEIYDNYIQENEHIQLQSYQHEMAIRELKKVKPCL